MGNNAKSAATPLNAIDIILSKRKISEDGCWLFTGAINKFGYGSIRIKFSKWNVKTLNTHRVFFLLYNGIVLNSNWLVLHKCKSRHCFNPQHLYLGTYIDNKRDAIKDKTASLNYNKDSKTGKFIKG